jgi:alpha-L-arabinofuranosidase
MIVDLYNYQWGYWVTDGMGLHELLMLCEALGSTPQMSVFTGYFMGSPYTPIGQASEYALAGVNMIE